MQTESSGKPRLRIILPNKYGAQWMEVDGCTHFAPVIEQFVISSAEFSRLCECDPEHLHWSLTKFRFEYFGVPVVVSPGPSR